MPVHDPTAINMSTDPTKRRFVGVTFHGNHTFDVPYMTKVADNLWQGGCTAGLRLPRDIHHLVSLYLRERYETNNTRTELYVTMYDSEDQRLDQVDRIAQWVNDCRDDGPVLVHCQAGLNRSSLIVARALHIREGWPGERIIAHLRAKRSPAVLCNPAFAAAVASWR
ncbi:protein-tyrosine phosphatase family protein [Mycolicibacterium fortuitum]|uniref:protein-tyrosine phosphatase family protein n=1 Tax=Mycolicibacterium fortuitum TaxID=1766 RepID=UPI002608A045|nr:dual specificity protein phosphatase [Mycolicibacterium fortuitum]